MPTLYIFLISEAAKKKEMERQKALAAAKLAMLKQKREKSNENLEAEMKNADETETIVILIKKMQDEELEFARKIIEEDGYKIIEKSHGKLESWLVKVYKMHNNSVTIISRIFIG